MLARENTIYTLEWNHSIIRNICIAKTYTLHALDHHLATYNDHMALKVNNNNNNNNKPVGAILAHRTTSKPTPPKHGRVAEHICSMFLDEYFGARAQRAWQIPFLFVWDCQRFGDGLGGPFGGHWSWQLQELQEGPDGHMRVVVTAMCCHHGLGFSQQTRHVFDLVPCWDGVYRAVHETAVCLWGAHFGHVDDEGLRCAVASGGMF